uniref:GPI mannosyltransferase 2 n=1 Tax=Nippostrongylus brasiliensis TaxID=27835 RepID=A0A0N4YSK2_NIPBR
LCRLLFLFRSNGLINIGYVGFFCLIDFLLGVDCEHPRRRLVIFRRPIAVIVARTAAFVMRMFLAVLSISLPIFIHGRRQQIAFCSQSSTTSVPLTLQRFAAENNLVTVGRTDVIDWCNVSSSIFPPFYASIQSKYWHVSLFGYWQLRKLPCFIMAAPALFLVVFGARQTWRRVTSKRSLFHLLAEGGDHVPYTLHAIFMAVGALFVYNVEVLTRMLFSSSPFPYLVLARWISDITPQKNVFISYCAPLRPVRATTFAVFDIFLPSWTTGIPTVPIPYGIFSVWNNNACHVVAIHVISVLLS